MGPPRLMTLALVWLGVSILCALVIVADKVINKPMLMLVMYAVWPINALYMGPIAVWAYWSLDRVTRALVMAGMGREQRGDDAPGEGGQEARMFMQKHMHQRAKRVKEQEPFWQLTFKAVTPCGSGCTLGDLSAEWTVFFAAWEFAGRAIWPEYIGDYTLAYLFGVAFQFFTIAPRRGLGLKQGIWATMKADTLALTAFEIGLFAWMACSAFLFFHPPRHPDSVVFWFMMQIGIVIGILTAYPMNWWLLKRGLKEKMQQRTTLESYR